MGIPTYSDAIKTAARQMVEEDLRHDLTNAGKPPHSVGWGFIKKDGKTTDVQGVVVKVNKKLTAQSMDEKSVKPAPKSVVVQGHCIPVDVVQVAQPRDQRLRTDNPHISAHGLRAFTTEIPNRGKFNCPIPGGVQIGPDKPWVGTAGCLLVYYDKVQKRHVPGVLTNAHVTGFNAEGGLLYQPNRAKGDWIARTARCIDLRLDGTTPNFIDAAVGDVLRTDGPYKRDNQLGGIHTFGSSLLGIGDVDPAPIAAELGMRVQKAGRTTGVTTGRVVTVDETTYVGYDEGTGYFKRQVSIEADEGDFSQGGDSGSLIVQKDTNRPTALLFAGGDGQTIGSPIQFVLEWLNGRFIKV